jgi:hypothetical protein
MKFSIITKKKVQNKYLMAIEFTFGISISGLDVDNGLYKENVYILSFATKM